MLSQNDSNFNQHTTFTFGLSTLLIATIMGTVNKRKTYYLNIFASIMESNIF